jgi:glycosyltransferase involved in cell wall biosynthesis
MSTNLLPLISIVIPTYEMKGQGLIFLKRCLSSIENQVDVDHQTIEVVVSDQSSNEVIEQFCNTYPNTIQYHRIKTKRGIAAHNLNKGITHASGEYVKILFQDDILVENNYLSELSNILHQKKPDVILTGALHTTDGKAFTSPITPQNNPYFLFGNNTASSPSVITLKREVATTLLFDEHLKMLFDCDFYYRLFNNDRNIIIDDQIHIANGIWEGQAQHQINQKQFTKEVRYLNWKYPQAGMKNMRPQYKAEFHRLHPQAQLPFSEELNLSWATQLLYRYLDKSSKQ